MRPQHHFEGGFWTSFFFFRAEPEDETERSDARLPDKPSSSRFRSSASCSRFFLAASLFAFFAFLSTSISSQTARANLTPSGTRIAARFAFAAAAAPAASTASSSSFVRAASLARSRSWRLPSLAATLSGSGSHPTEVHSPANLRVSVDTGGGGRTCAVVLSHVLLVAHAVLELLFEALVLPPFST